MHLTLGPWKERLITKKEARPFIVFGRPKMSLAAGSITMM